VELHDNNDNVNDAALKANSLMRPMMKHLVLNVDEVDGEAKKILNDQGEKLNTAVNTAPLNDEQKANEHEINAATDDIVATIMENPEANAALERIRARTIPYITKEANLYGRQAADIDRKDIEKLIDVGVKFVVNLLQNQLRQDDFYTIITEKLSNLLLAIQVIYERIIKVNAELIKEKPLSATELILKLVGTLRKKFIEFLSETTLVHCIRRQLTKVMPNFLCIKTAVQIGVFAIVIYRFRHYFHKSH